MDSIQLSEQQVKNICTIIPSAILNEYLLSFSFNSFKDIIGETSPCTQFELSLELSPELEFYPTQRSTIKIDYNKSLKIHFSYFVRLNDSLSLNQKTGLETILQSLKVSYQCLES